MLKVSSSTVWRCIHAEKLPVYRVGPRDIRVRKADLLAMITPAKRTAVDRKREHEDIWAGYDPEKVEEVLAETAGSWAEIDAEALIANIYRARAEGTRPAERPDVLHS